MVQKTEKVWMDGRLIPWGEANIHVSTHALHYGTAVFEGIRAYKCSNGCSAVFRLNDHINRFYYSAAEIGITIPFRSDDIEKAILETIRANSLEECYIRPIVFVGEGEMGPAFHGNPIRTAIIVWEWKHYLSKEAGEKGIAVKISEKYCRVSGAMPFSAKVSGNYVNACLAKKEAEAAGFQEALLLNEDDYFAECSTENIFMIKGETLMTPRFTLPILRGVTRDSVIQLAKHELGLNVIEYYFNISVLIGVDEVFLTGTAAEVAPVRIIDKWKIGQECPGPITKKLQDLYFKAVHGELPKYSQWLTYV